LLKALKPPLSGSNDISLISITLISITNITLISITLASIITNNIINNDISKTDVNINLYELNKLNTRKPSFTEDKEMIIRYKFKYFKKDDKKD
jgi:hypothetical protein